MLGLLFGSFDPIHNGHLQIARWALSQGCSEVWFMVQPENAYKGGMPHADFDERVTMAGLAVTVSDHLQAVAVASRDLKHIVRDTLIDLKAHQPALILGSDLAETIDEWPDYAPIREHSKILTHPRFDTPSSSVIRARIATSESIADAVPSDVAEYIYVNNLYK